MPPEIPPGRMALEMTDAEKQAICAWSDELKEHRRPRCDGDEPYIDGALRQCEGQVPPNCELTFEMIVACAVAMVDTCINGSEIPLECYEAARVCSVFG